MRLKYTFHEVTSNVNQDTKSLQTNVVKNLFVLMIMKTTLTVFTVKTTPDFLLWMVKVTVYKTHLNILYLRQTVNLRDLYDYIEDKHHR